MFWGLSESLDLYNEYLLAMKNKDSNEAESSELDDNITSINILCFGAGDPRHIIKTIGKLYTQHANKRPHINFYCVEGCIEIVARNIVLLAIALENPECLSLHKKVHLFMDIYGNSLLRPSSNQYLISKAKQLLNMITDSDYMQQAITALNIESLKYRERDGLENAFTFLLSKDGHLFNIKKYWEDCVRNLLKDRFDYREGAFDWDLQMTLKDRGAKQICSQEYRYWREIGIAFTFPEYEQCKPNKTLVAGLIRNGEKYMHRGYIGDIQVGPFCTFGLQSSDEKMLKSSHGDNEYRSTDLCERNLLEIFYEIQTRAEYHHAEGVSRKYGSVLLQMGKTLVSPEIDSDSLESYDKPWIDISGINIHLLSADEILCMQNSPDKWSNFFDISFVGHNYFAFLRKPFVDVMKENSLIIFETKLYTLIKREQVTEFETKIKNFAHAANLRGVTNYSAINGKYTVLKYKRTIRKD